MVGLPIAYAPYSIEWSSGYIAILAGLATQAGVHTNWLYCLQVLTV